MNWWSRYFIGIPLLLIVLEFDTLLERVLIKRKTAQFALVVIVCSSLISGFSYLAYKEYLRTSWPGQLGLGQPVANLIGPGCKNVIVIGEGLTFSTALWGESRCSFVIDSIHFGNLQEQLGQYGSLELKTSEGTVPRVLRDISAHGRKAIVIILTGLNSGSKSWSESLISTLSNLDHVGSTKDGQEANGNRVKVISILRSNN
jgi:hypothetical protein